MVRSLLCFCLVVPVMGMLAQPTEARGKKAFAKVKGKAYFTNMVLSDKSLQALAEKFAEKEPSIALTRASDDTWSATMVAFLSRKPARGPITLWFYDKEKPGTPLDTKSMDRKIKKHLVYDMLLDGELGFKMCRTYLVQVGQILKGKNKVYATGEVLTDSKNAKCRAGKKKARKKAPSK